MDEQSQWVMPDIRAGWGAGSGTIIQKSLYSWYNTIRISQNVTVYQLAELTGPGGGLRRNEAMHVCKSTPANVEEEEPPPT